MAKEKTKGEYEDYAEIVAAVKAKAVEARAEHKKMTGDEVTREIQKRWAKRQGRKFQEPPGVKAAEPAGPGLGASPLDREVSPAKAKINGAIKLPDPAFNDGGK